MLKCIGHSTIELCRTFLEEEKGIKGLAAMRRGAGITNAAFDAQLASGNDQG
jgi:hypothetical protein